MKERPIIFSAPMIRALLAGAKTQTRRVVKPQPPSECTDFTFMPVSTETAWRGPGQPVVRHPGPPRLWLRCPYGAPGDRLWLRETWALLTDPGAYVAWSLDAPERRPSPTDTYLGHVPTPIYRADGERTDVRQPTGSALRWRSPIHMPRWASRISLEITTVRVERLHAISEDDARAEGVPLLDYAFGQAYGGALTGDGVTRVPMASARDAFADLWREINGDASWDANPWVWVVAFERVTPCA